MTEDRTSDEAESTEADPPSVDEADEASADETGADPPADHDSTPSEDRRGRRSPSHGSGRALGSGESTDGTGRSAPEATAGVTEPEAGTGSGPDGDRPLGADASDPVGPDEPTADVDDEVPPDVRSYDRFQKVDRASYDRVNEFLRDRTYVTAREWAIARLCADFRTATGVEMTKIGENLPHLVPFMTDTYSPQAVNQARAAFEEKVRMAGATFLYGAMSGFFTADELDDLMYEVTEVAKFLLEVEGVELTVEEELDAEDRISAVMREVRQASEELRYDEVACPHCGQAFQPDVED